MNRRAPTPAVVRATLTAAQNAYSRSMQLHIDNRRLRRPGQQRAADDGTAQMAILRSSWAQHAAAQAKVTELQKLLLQDLASLRASGQQQAILVQQIETLTALLAARDAEIQALSAVIDELDAEIQRSYDPQTQDIA